MKKVLLLIAAILLPAFAVGCSPQSVSPALSDTSTIPDAPEVSSATPEIQEDTTAHAQATAHPIDAAFEAALKELPDQNPNGYVMVQYKYAEQWKAEMEKTYDLLLPELREDHKQLLISSQKNWEEYASVNDTLEYEVVSYACGGGTMMRVVASEHYYNRYRDRALHLTYLRSQLDDYQRGIAYREHLDNIEND